MTRDDCYKSLLNTKVFVKDKSASIQCILFSLGFEWNGDSSCSSLVRRTDAPFLFISEDGKITCSNSTEHFYSMNNKEVSAEYILSMKYIDEELSVSYLSPWISVNEKLPPVEKDNLSIKVIVVSTKGKIDFSRYDYDIEGWISPVLDIEFTHWMPIPKLPKRIGDKTMTREQAKELFPIIQAFAKGKTIQDWINDTWKDKEYTSFGELSQSPIKPEQKYKIMTREKAKELLPIIQALAEGKTIQYRVSPSFPRPNNRDISYVKEWFDIDEDKCDGFSCDGTIDYRIKPEPKYRPFKTKEECWNEMLKHQPFGWITSKKTDNYVFIDYVGELNSCVCISFTAGESELYPAEMLFDNYKFVDGTPFGMCDD